MQRESKVRWDAEHITTVSFRCHNEKDKDILDRLAAQPAETGGKQGYIKRLIRRDVEVGKMCSCCFGDEAVFYENNENNAFIDSRGEMLVTSHDKTIRFKVLFCPVCGRKFTAAQTSPSSAAPSASADC